MTFPKHGILLLLGLGLRLGLSLGLTAAGVRGQQLDTLQPIQGEVVGGRVTTIDAAGRVTVAIADQAGEKEITRALGDLRVIDLAASPGPPVPPQGVVALRSGIRIPATVREMAERRVTFDSPLLGGRGTIGLSHLHSIRFARLAVADDGGFAKYDAEPKDDKDLIYFKTEDKIVQRSVTIEGFEDGAVIYRTRNQLRKRPFTELYGIVMGTASGFPPDPLERPRVVLGMQGGAAIRGRLRQLGPDTAVIELAEQITLQVLRPRLRRITVESDRLLFLADLDPSEVKQVPAFRKKRPWLENRSALGAGLQLGGATPRTAQNGLMLPPKTSLTYEIGGKFDFFMATIGIDRRSTGPAHAIFRVLDGDKVLYESDPVTQQTEPIAIKVPVAKVQRLTIQADFGKNYDFGDHCVFAEARVIKQGP